MTPGGGRSVLLMQRLSLQLKWESKLRYDKLYMCTCLSMFDLLSSRDKSEHDQVQLQTNKGTATDKAYG